MNNISLIAAIGRNNELGKNNKLIWYIPEDLAFFKNTTFNHKVVMGYNTFLSIGKALPNRDNIVITRKDIVIPNVTIYHSFDEILKNEIDDEVFIIGGATLYNYFYDYANKMYLTHIKDESDADAYFPEFDDNDWDKFKILENEENGIQYERVLYKRK